MSVESLPPEPEVAYVLREVEADDFVEKAPKAYLTEDTIKDYLRAIGRYPLLSAEQEVEMSKRIEAGLYAAHLLEQKRENEKAQLDRGETVLWDAGYWADVATLAEQGEQTREQFYNSNLRLVVSIAKRYTGRGVQFIDLIQFGNEGLDRAVKKFDYTRGYKFSTYGTNWIRQTITRGMADTGSTIRKPVHVVEQIKKVDKVKRTLELKNGREPTDNEIASEMEVSANKLQLLKEYAREPYSLNQPTGDGNLGGTAEFGEFLPDTSQRQPEDVAMDQILREAINDALSVLSEQEQKVIILRFGLNGNEPHTLQEIGRVIGKTHETARKLQAQALTRLRKHGLTSGLKDYLIES